MQLKDFDFHLPNELIAQYPLVARTGSSLLCLNRQSGEIVHQKISDFPNFLKPNDVLVFNDTRVIPAKMFAHKMTGGKVEILFARRLAANRFLAHLKANKSLRIGTELTLVNPPLFQREAGGVILNNQNNDTAAMTIIDRADDLFILELAGDHDILTICQKFGHVPLPPYITRHDETSDKERYQTVFAANLGAIAAPTAGLHFDQELLQKISAQNIAIAYITLHVGAGTFQPVRVENIAEHKMHSEEISVSDEICAKILTAKARGGRVIAVGTTVARSLETAAASGTIKPFCGETDIFIRPGYKFQCIDALLTNFHLPKSTLLMLVAAFAGYENMWRAYHAAIENKYRFFSYGDAMLITDVTQNFFKK